MTFNRDKGQEREAKAYEVAGQLDDIITKIDIGTLEKAIRYMGQNTRGSLKRALEVVEQKM